MKFLTTFLILVFTSLGCQAQQTAEEYAAYYNKIAPKLQQIAKKNTTSKQSVQNFESFIKTLDEDNIKVFRFACYGKTDYSPDLYYVILTLVPLETSQIANDQGYASPRIWVKLKNQIPNEINGLARKYEGQLTPEVRKFLAKREIESIEFYGIKGLKSVIKNRKMI